MKMELRLLPRQQAVQLPKWRCHGRPEKLGTREQEERAFRDSFDCWTSQNRQTLRMGL